MNIEKFKVIEEFDTTNQKHHGRILHAKANMNIVDLEYLYGLYLIGDKAFQVIGCCNSEDFQYMRNIFIRIINSFEFTGKIIIINDKTAA